jgi:tyrosinase
MATVERRDVYALGERWHPILRAYALAVGVMRTLPATDARSLAYQASVHGVGDEADPPPDSFRGQCQHNSWYFLPWHRWYLFYFEQIVRSLLVDIDEVPAEVAESWALPYWNYARTGAGRLPPEFAAPRLWDGRRRNPLFDPTRSPAVNARTARLDPRQTVPGVRVLRQPFSSTSPGVATFGGTASGWHHFREPGAVAGGIETTPHNDVHGFVGGNMWRFAEAGLDPVFWLHHCNIDRYWEVRGHATDPSGWAAVSFDFRDAEGAARTVDADGCVDTAGQLGYVYDDVTPPAPPTPGQRVRATRSAQMAESPPPELPPEVVGTRGAVRLEGARVDAPLQVGGVSSTFRKARGGRSEPQRVFLTIEDITGDINPGISYGVYVGEDADDSMLAGLISFFGIESTRAGGHALGYTFDVTDIVSALRDDDSWDPADVHVIFRPVGPVLDEEEPDSGDAVPVEVGSISVVYQ